VHEAPRGLLTPYRKPHASIGLRIEPAIEKRIQRLRSKGYGILKIARKLGVGTSAVQRVIAAG
jgi:DNA invertase Pin-like site-specific DNA recombinase